jgi:DNA-binding ferritin-like protein (Dps family)
MKKQDDRVHLDHLIKRLSIRYLKNNTVDENDPFVMPKRISKDKEIRYTDIDGEWFSNIKKPDFQRETNSWTPNQCVDFLDSITNERIIPSIILWQSDENSLVYVLDGAHRLSVIKAWMSADWGDKAEEGYYQRRNEVVIKRNAMVTRNLVNQRIGSFENFKTAFLNLQIITKKGGSPKNELSELQFKQANFYSDFVIGNRVLYVQWEHGNYDSAEQSFLRINRQGTALDPWESTLIEFRNGSYSRVIMSIANMGENGHYWPDDNSLSDELKNTIKEFSKKCFDIHEKLFIPPFKGPITDLTVPLMVAPAYFQKHKYLMEVLPLLISNEIAIENEKQIDLLKRDTQETAEVVIKNASNNLNKIQKTLENIISKEHNPTCLSLVPLFYFYNERGQYVRGLFYGFLYWLLSGTEDEVKNKKLIFSAYRDKFENALFYFKSDIAHYLNLRGGAGLKAVKQMYLFLENIFQKFNQQEKVTDLTNDDLKNFVLESLNETNLKKRKATEKKARSVSRKDKSQINIKELFNASPRCHICGGIINLGYGGIQYDHYEKPFAITQKTDVNDTKPTHPYCNRQKDIILSIRSGKKVVHLAKKLSIEKKAKKIPSQLVMLFWGEDDYPR